MTAKVYGLIGSRALRNLWMLEELHVPYELVETDFRRGDTRKPHYLRLNPNGRIPTFQDGDTVLFESMAINLYLAMNYESCLWPKDPESQGRVLQWTLWAVNELERPLVDLVLNRIFLPESERNPALIERALETLSTPFRILNEALDAQPYLLGATFTAADLNVAIVMNYARMGDMNLKWYAHLTQWLDACLGRPALQAARTPKSA